MSPAANQPESISKEKRLGKYAVLAGATLAFPLAAHADTIFYSGIQDITETSSLVSGDVSYPLELDGTSNSLFTFNASYTNADVTVTPGGTNGYVAAAGEPAPLVAGTPIDGSSTFQNSLGTLQSGYIFQKGPWPTDGSFAYLGVQFFVSGQPFYGWVYLSATAPAYEGGSVATFTIQDWAYNTVSGDAINAGQGQVPEPSSLALLALGALGLTALRARRARLS